MMTRPARATLPLPALALALLALAACGGETPPPAVPTSPATDTPASTSGATTASSPSGTAVLTAAGSAGSQKAERRTSATWTACHASAKPDPSGDPATNVDVMAKACAATTGMRMLQSFKGTQAASGLPQSFPFHAEASHCYRAYAYAAPAIKDLDVLIKDSAGAVAGEDSTDDPSPVVLEDGAVCFKSADDATVVVSIGAGSGAYAVQVWGD